MTSILAALPSNRVAIPGRDKRFSSPKYPDRTCIPPTLVFSWFRFLFFKGIKQPVYKKDYSPPPSSEIKDIWRFPSAPPMPAWRSAE